MFKLLDFILQTPNPAYRYQSLGCAHQAPPSHMFFSIFILNFTNQTSLLHKEIKFERWKYINLLNVLLIWNIIELR